MSHDLLNEIASKHLGKASDGTTVNPYSTPDSVDASLLVAVPRQLNRTQYGIKEENQDFGGYDVWNCYEVSFLLENGLPVSGVMKLIYPSWSPNIVESKSLKLYLNSFNMVKFNCLSVDCAIDEFLNEVKHELSNCVGTDVDVKFQQDQSATRSVDLTLYDTLESVVNYGNMEFNVYTESPDILEVDTSGTVELHAHSSLLRSNCRVTHQPDWGDVFIDMIGLKVPSKESLLKYIVSMRKENHFHEEICECIYQRLWDKFSPDLLVVKCLYTRRGGIDINPIRYSDGFFNDINFDNLVNTDCPVKTLRQ